MVNITCPSCGKDISLEVGGKKESVIVPIPYTHIETSIKPNTSSESFPMVNTEKASTMRNGINVEGEIINKSKPRTVNKKAGGTIEICDATLVDSIGKIDLQIWGDETKTVNNGDKVRIINGYTNTFKGDVFLTVGKYGKMEVLK